MADRLNVRLTVALEATDAATGEAYFSSPRDPFVYFGMTYAQFAELEQWLAKSAQSLADLGKTKK